MSRNVFLASLSCLRRKCVLCLDFLLLPQKLLTTWLIVPGSDTQELCLIENLNLNNFKLHWRSIIFSNNLKRRTLNLHADEIRRLPFIWIFFSSISTWHDLICFNLFWNKDRKFSNCRIDFDHFWKLNWVSTLRIICSIKYLGKN